MSTFRHLISDECQCTDPAGLVAHDHLHQVLHTVCSLPLAKAKACFVPACSSKFDWMHRSACYSRAKRVLPFLEDKCCCFIIWERADWLQWPNDCTIVPKDRPPGEPACDQRCQQSALRNWSNAVKQNKNVIYVGTRPKFLNLQP
jgi:hypothetical protein